MPDLIENERQRHWSGFMPAWIAASVFLKLKMTVSFVSGCAPRCIISGACSRPDARINR